MLSVGVRLSVDAEVEVERAQEGGGWVGGVGKGVRAGVTGWGRRAGVQVRAVDGIYAEGRVLGGLVLGRGRELLMYGEPAGPGPC